VKKRILAFERPKRPAVKLFCSKRSVWRHRWRVRIGWFRRPEGSRIPFEVGVCRRRRFAERGSTSSTFAAHLKILNEATTAIGPNNLLLIDEICGSTDPDEGTALARSFIQAYAEQGARVINVALRALKLGWESSPAS